MKLQLRRSRIIFFGTGYFAAYHLHMLLYCSAHKIYAIFTQETQSLNKTFTPSIIQIATAYNITIFQSRYLLMSDIVNIITPMKIDIIIVVSYGLILPKKILDIPKLGCINVHGSLLPRWRGAAPIQRAIEAGDIITGISIILMDSGIDTGNILYTKTCKILSTDTTYTLSKKLAKIGSIALLKIIEKIITKTYKLIPQNSLHTTYAYKIKKKEAHIQWKLSAIILERRIRAFNPWPISYFYVEKIRIRVWAAKTNYQNINQQKKIHPGTILRTDSSGIYVATGFGILILTVLQIPNKTQTIVKDLLNAYKRLFIPNTILK